MAAGSLDASVPRASPVCSGFEGELSWLLLRWTRACVAGGAGAGRAVAMAAASLDASACRRWCWGWEDCRHGCCFSRCGWVLPVVLEIGGGTVVAFVALDEGVLGNGGGR